jgi:hypothetical protein
VFIPNEQGSSTQDNDAMLVVDVLQLPLVLVGGGLQRCVEILDIVPVGNADIGEHCKCAATLPLKYSLPKMVCA